MSNETPFAVTNEILTRSNGCCELCGGRNRNHPHHIVFRRYRNHNPEAIIMICKDHDPHDNPEINTALKSMLCKYYESQGYTAEDIRPLMGGKYYDTSEDLDPIYLGHLRRLKRIYGG